MVTLSHDAQSYLQRYLRQLKAALRGHPSVDAGEVERDVLGHIEAELAGQQEPVGAASLRHVLDRLGTPDQWIPSEDLPAWRRTLNKMRAGPEDWRLAYLTFACFMLGPALFIGGPVLWPLPPVLGLASFVFARATVSLLAEHDEPVGARRWLIYPPLVFVYAAAALVLLGWPVPPTILGVTDTPVITEAVARPIPGPAWFGATLLTLLTLGSWWVILGSLARRFTEAVRITFLPFADWFTRRHAAGLIVTGAVMAILSGGVILVAVVWRPTPVEAAQTAGPIPALPSDPITGILDAFRSHRMVALGEGTHGNEQGHAFRLALIRDPRFAQTVNDIVVESLAHGRAVRRAPLSRAAVQH
jgi:hypothetical protein